ncbi:hypothetical protein HLH17_11675 [Acinetobacter sp. ANC 5380]|uniref:Uncharacterized protein n=1 Tax=Acinetobacter terrae TaxID=2731247 RepID=A0A7Y2RGE2_9GAMM|nr:hypothetical protein [Acinetobacter terrae]NNH78317.1 hypothetical protein [Acinetobacter terrae]
MTNLTAEQYQAISNVPVEFRSEPQKEAIRAYEELHNMNVDGDLPVEALESTPAPSVIEAKGKETAQLESVSEVITTQSEEVVEDAELGALMQAKKNVHSQMLPAFTRNEVADFILVANVAECFAEHRTHTIAYDVPKELREPFNMVNAYQSFRSILTSELMSREIKSELSKKSWATICTEYTTESTGTIRNTEADKSLKYGSQVISYSDILKYTHNPENFLGHVKVEFETASLEGLKTEVDAWLDIDIDEARIMQKKWYTKNASSVLELLGNMDQYKPPRLTEVKFQRYKLLLAIATLWGKEHFNNVLTIVNEIALTNGIAEHEKFACALKKALDNAQAHFAQLLTQMPSDTIIAELNKLEGFNYSRQTLPTALADLKVNKETARKSIVFFGNTVQGYEVELLTSALTPFFTENDEAVTKYLDNLKQAA